MAGFYNTVSPKYYDDFIFFIGYDDNDFFIKERIDEIRQRIHKTDIIVEFDGKITNGNPCEAWNILARKAFSHSENIDYFYQVGSDTMHLTPYWDRYFINILTKNDNDGICGGVDKRFYLERTLRNDRGII